MGVQRAEQRGIHNHSGFSTLELLPGRRRCGADLAIEWISTADRGDLYQPASLRAGDVCHRGKAGDSRQIGAPRQGVEQSLDRRAEWLTADQREVCTKERARLPADR